ncbi:uncharacterized protein METZ01_LOCUS397029, partial [marine metagenome]
MSRRSEQDTAHPNGRHAFDSTASAISLNVSLVDIRSSKAPEPTIRPSR